MAALTALRSLRPGALPAFDLDFNRAQVVPTRTSSLADLDGHSLDYNRAAMALVRLPAAPVDFRRAQAALGRATKLADVVRIRDSAEAVRVACTKAKAGLAMANQAAELRIRAERKAGRLLLGVERSDAGRPAKNTHHRGGNFARVLRDLDLPDTTARRRQAEAKIAADVFEQFIRETTTAAEELTSAGLLRSVQRPFVPVVTIRDDRIMTPLPVATTIVAALRPSGTILEPFAGDGSFVRALKPYGRVRWCEIDRGRDFFAWNKPIDWIISNPTVVAVSGRARPRTDARRARRLPRDSQSLVDAGARAQRAERGVRVSGPAPDRDARHVQGDRLRDRRDARRARVLRAACDSRALTVEVGWLFGDRPKPIRL